MKTHRHLSALLAASVLLGLPSPDGVTAQERVDISGVVIDVDTQEGISDVILRVDGTTVSAASDDEGRFILRGVPPGEWTLLVEHLAYGSHEHRIAVSSGESVEIRVRMAQEAIELDPLVVEGETTVQRQRRTTGASFWEVTYDEIQASLGTSRHMGDLIRQTVPGLKLRQSNSLSQNDICLEFRSAASISIVNAKPCNHPMVLLDGVVVNNPQYLYGSVGLSNLERIQVIPPGEAGARYGTGSLYGVILIETQRPGVRGARNGSADRAGLVSRKPFSFDWDQDPAGHSTGRTLLGAAAGNALGLGLGLALARECIAVSPDDDIQTSCGATTNVAAGLSAFVLPAVGSALGARWAGGTERSVGRLVPALVGAGMMLFPGYAFSLSTVGGDQAVVNTIGYAFLSVGVPLAVTLADKLFRDLR